MNLGSEHNEVDSDSEPTTEHGTAENESVEHDTEHNDRTVEHETTEHGRELGNSDLYTELN